MNKRLLSVLPDHTHLPESIQSACRDGVCVSFRDLVALEEKASGFSFLPRQPVHSVLSGRHASRLRGRGMQFEDIRPYLLGDDVRNMDWQVMARTRKPHVRVYSEERDRPMYCIVDQRPNQFFGSQHCFKSVVAARAAALAIWRAFASGDRVGGCLLGCQGVQHFKPARSKKAVLSFLNAIAVASQALLQRPLLTDEHRAGLNQGLSHAARHNAHDGLICVISDGCGRDDITQQSLAMMAAKNDVLWVTVFDPLEKTLPNQGRFLAGDGVRQLSVNLNERKWRQTFEAEVQQEQDGWAGFCKQHRIPMLTLNTVEAVEEQVRRQLGYIPRSRFRRS